MCFLWFPMVFLWFSHGLPMVSQWFSEAVPMVFVFVSYGVHVAFLWFAEVLRWLSCGFPMDFLGFSYGVFLGFPLAFLCFLIVRPVVFLTVNPSAGHCARWWFPTGDATLTSNVLFSRETDSGHIVPIDDSLREASPRCQMCCFLENSTAGTLCWLMAPDGCENNWSPAVKNARKSSGKSTERNRLGLIYSCHKSANKNPRSLLIFCN